MKKYISYGLIAIVLLALSFSWQSTKTSIKDDLLDSQVYTACLVTDDRGIGISQFSEGKLGRHNGKQVKWEDLDNGLKMHIIARLTEATA